MQTRGCGCFRLNSTKLVMPYIGICKPFRRAETASLTCVHTQDLNAIKLQAFVIELGLNTRRLSCRARPFLT